MKKNARVKYDIEETDNGVILRWPESYDKSCSVWQTDDNEVPNMAGNMDTIYRNLGRAIYEDISREMNENLSTRIELDIEIKPLNPLDI